MGLLLLCASEKNLHKQTEYSFLYDSYLILAKPKSFYHNCFQEMVGKET